MKSSPGKQLEPIRPHPLLKVLAILLPPTLTAVLICLLMFIHSCKPDVNTWSPKVLWKGEAYAVFDGQLRSSEGLGLEEGAPCRVVARLSNTLGLDERSLHATIELSCGGKRIFKGSSLSEESDNFIRCTINENASIRPDTYQFWLDCKSEAQQGENLDVVLKMSSWDQQASLSRNDEEPFAVIDLEGPSRPLRGPPLYEGLVKDPGFSQPVVIQGEVSEIEGREELEHGAPCEVWIRPFWNRFSCIVEIECGESQILHGSYNRCEVEEGMPVRAQDEWVDDGDAKMDLEISDRHVRIFDDESETTWSVSISLKDPVLRDVCPDGFEDRPNEDGVDFCLLRPLVLPEAEDVEAECEELQQGVLGFRWTPGEASEDYTCPRGAERVEDDETARCLWTLPELPSREVFPVCQELLSDRVLGFYLGE